MKFTVALVALFLVCAAQARAVEDDDKEQLHVFLTLKPALTAMYHEVEKIKSDMENAKKEAAKIFVGHEEDVLVSLLPGGSLEMQTLVDKLKIDKDQCIEIKSSRSLQTVNNALKMLNKIFVDKQMKDLEQLNMSEVKAQYHQLLKELEECQPSEKIWEDFIARLKLVGNTVRNCLLNSSNEKKVE